MDELGDNNFSLNDLDLFDEEVSTTIVSGWKVMVVDDEPDIHAVTRMALEKFDFDGMGLNLLHAHSGKEAISLAEENPDCAMILMDVVMESEHAGLEAINYIRNILGNKRTRIVLRTGQPGQAPEQQVIRDYDINDYKAKSELTSRALYTSVTSSLRAYRDIMALEASRRGLLHVVAASHDLYRLDNQASPAQALLNHAEQLLKTDWDMGLGGGCLARNDENGWTIIAGRGRFIHLAGSNLQQEITAERWQLCQTTMSKYEPSIDNSTYTRSFTAEAGGHYLFYAEGIGQIGAEEAPLLDLLFAQAQQAFLNLALKTELEETQRELVHRLSGAVEARSPETGNHIKRVAEYARLIALGAGLPEEEADLVYHAAPLHDVGKIAVPDNILNKPGRHDEAEREIMKRHADLGFEMLRHSNRDILLAGAFIARDHHEKWDGTGYPRGLKGNQIHLFGRIVALADVFDALLTPRCYKPAWSLSEVLDYIQAEKGSQFDPHLVEVLLAQLDRIIAVRDLFADV